MLGCCKVIVVVDFKNLAYNCFHKSLANARLKPETCPEGYFDHIFNFRFKLDKILSGLQWSRLIFAMERRPDQKYAIFPEYKGKREKLPFDPIPALLNMLGSWGSESVFAEGFEADDAMASVVAQNFDTPVVVATTDRDLWQVLDHPNAQVFDFAQSKFINRTHLEQKFGIDEYRHLKLVKTLWGDSGDGVPNLVPRMQKWLRPVVKQSDGSLEDFLEKVETAETTPRCKELLAQNLDRLKINFELVRLSYDCELTYETILKPEVKEQINELPW